VTYIIMDIETTGLDRFKDEINYIGVKIPDYGYRDIFEDSGQGWGSFINFLKRLPKDAKFVWQNGKFDTLFIYEKMDILLPIDEDTMVMSYVLDMGKRKSLEHLAEKHLGTKSWDIPLKEKLKKSETTKKYLYEDLEQSWGVFSVLHQMLMDSEFVSTYYDLSLPSYVAFRDGAEMNGIYVDREKLLEVKEDYEKKLEEVQEKLDKIADINWRSPTQLALVLYEQLNLPTLKRTPSGNPSCDAKTLKALKGMHPVVDHILEHRKYSQAIGTFLKPWEELTRTQERLYPTFNVDTVRTGRTSCSDPNLQQVPRDKNLRNLFTAPKGKVFAEIDYSQIELRVAAMIAKETNMLDVYKRDGDIHTETAVDVLGIDGDKVSKKDRTSAKAVNFGFLYGMGAKSFKDYALNTYGVKFTELEAEAYRDRFFKKFPDLQTWYHVQRNHVEVYGGVYTLFNRFRALPDIYSSTSFLQGKAYRQGINTPVQSVASDILLCAMVEIQNKKIPGVKVCGTVHDAILFEAETEEQLKEVKDIMENPRLLEKFGIEFPIPLKADISIGPWGS